MDDPTTAIRQALQRADEGASKWPDRNGARWCHFMGALAALGYITKDEADSLIGQPDQPVFTADRQQVAS